MSRTIKTTFPISPVSASRPRLSARGHAYFQGPYKIFKEEMTGLAPITLGHDFELFEDYTNVVIQCRPTRPKTTKLRFPGPDVDNYAKSLFDSMNGKLWTDDKMVQKLTIDKEWAEAGTPGWWSIDVKEI